MDQTEFEFYYVTTELDLTRYEILLIQIGLEQLQIPGYTQNLEDKLSKIDHDLEKKIAEIHRGKK